MLKGMGSSSRYSPSFGDSCMLCCLSPDDMICLQVLMICSCFRLAKKAFTGYLRSLQLTPQQRIDVSSLQLGEFAKALGLPFTPPLPLLNPEASTEEREAIRSKKNVNRSLDKLKKQIKEAKEEKRRQRLQSQEISSSHRKSSSSDDEEEEDDSEEEEEFFQVKQTHDWNQQGMSSV